LFWKFLKVSRNNGGNHCDEMTRAEKVKDFKDDFRRPVDKSQKMENMKRKKEMMRNIHAIGIGGLVFKDFSRNAESCSDQ
jgi:hypothetical protein